MLDFDLIKNILIISVASSVITTAFVQKIKETINFKKSNRILIVSFIVSIIIGPLFALSFSNINIINSLWVGLISFLGADVIYKMFEDKIFMPFNQIYKKDLIEIPKENVIE